MTEAGTATSINNETWKVTDGRSATTHSKWSAPNFSSTSVPSHSPASLRPGHEGDLSWQISRHRPHDLLQFACSHNVVSLQKLEQKECQSMAPLNAEGGKQSYLGAVSSGGVQMLWTSRRISGQCSDLSLQIAIISPDSSKVISWWPSLVVTLQDLGQCWSIILRR